MRNGLLIVGTSYVATDERFWLVRQWAHAVTTLNPGTPVLVIDTPADEGPGFPDIPGIEVIRLLDNVGHLMRSNGRDGSGRALCRGVAEAALRGYSEVAFIDTDVLLAKPVQWILDWRSAVEAGRLPPGRTYRAIAPHARPHALTEAGLMFLRIDPAWVQWFVRAYDWQGMRPSMEPGAKLPEQRIQEMLGDSLLTIPNAALPGCRGEGECAQTPATAGWLSWLTHSTRECYEAFLLLNGLGIA